MNIDCELLNYLAGYVLDARSENVTWRNNEGFICRALELKSRKLGKQWVQFDSSNCVDVYFRASNKLLSPNREFRTWFLNLYADYFYDVRLKKYLERFVYEIRAVSCASGSTHIKAVYWRLIRINSNMEIFLLEIVYGSEVNKVTSNLTRERQEITSISWMLDMMNVINFPLLILPHGICWFGGHLSGYSF